MRSSDQLMMSAHSWHDRVGFDRDPLARARIRLTYLWRHGRLPELADPRRFTELVQQRKLTDRDPTLPLRSDKVAVKSFVADRIGDGWVTPTLWQGAALPDLPCWPMPFVVKSRHGCNQHAFVRSDSVDWPAVQAAARGWMRRRYGLWLDEWSYRDIPLGLLVEPFIGPGGALPIDYKFFVFGGEVTHIQVHLDRERRHRWILFDARWRRVSALTADADPPRPMALGRMIEAAEALGSGLSFVRVDLYETLMGPRFGEMTFYPGSGLDRFDPVALDAALGRRWLEARDRQPGFDQAALLA